MKTNKYNWKSSDILKKYFKCLKKLIFCKDNNKKLELILDINNLKDMILFSILNIPDYKKNPNTKQSLYFDKYFMDEEVTDFQNNNIKNFIDTSLNKRFMLTDALENYNEENLIENCMDFLKLVNIDLQDELITSIKDKRLHILNNKKERNFSGVTYCLEHENYYQICKNSLTNIFLTLNHELCHGYINIITKRKFDKEEKVILYREVASLLIELYSNKYLLKNNKISYEEFVSNFNDFLLITVYDSIEIIDTLYDIVTNKLKINDININEFINKKRMKNENYNFDEKELTELPLKHHLIYLYSSMIALGIYYNYLDNEKEGLEVAFNIMENINEYNEEELLNKYNINPLESLNKYIDENNELIKKMNN